MIITALTKFNSNLCAMLPALITVLLFTGCDDTDPKKENTPELITKATLTFTPADGGSPVTASATDPDGEGVQNITVDGPIELAVDENYTLTITLLNELFDPSQPEYNITAEVEAEADEHLLFFAWTNDVFSDPSGNGNVDNRSDDVNYNDQDKNQLPVGLNSLWNTAGSAATGTFRVVLKHQPGLKSETSTATTGESDLDLTFTINVN